MYIYTHMYVYIKVQHRWEKGGPRSLATLQQQQQSEWEVSCDCIRKRTHSKVREHIP